MRGRDHSYIFHSFTACTPPGLSAADKSLREHLDGLERERIDIIAERARLEAKLKEIEEESRRMYVFMLANLEWLADD